MPALKTKMRDGQGMQAYGRHGTQKYLHLALLLHCPFLVLGGDPNLLAPSFPIFKVGKGRAWVSTW